MRRPRISYNPTLNYWTLAMGWDSPIEIQWHPNTRPWRSGAIGLVWGTVVNDAVRELQTHWHLGIGTVSIELRLWRRAYLREERAYRQRLSGDGA